MASFRERDVSEVVLGLDPHNLTVGDLREFVKRCDELVVDDSTKIEAYTAGLFGVLTGLQLRIPRNTTGGPGIYG